MKRTSFSEDPRSQGARSNSALHRGATILNSPSAVQVVDQQSEVVLYQQREGECLREIAKSWLPRDPEAFSLWAIELTALGVGIANFCHSGDTSMLMALLLHVTVHGGVKEALPWLKEVISLLKGNKKGDDQQS